MLRKKRINNKDDILNRYSKRIEQTDNFNSYSELFIKDNEVIKIYTDCYDRVKYNIVILKDLLKRRRELSKIKELVLPNNLINYKNNTIGFSMNYIEGLTLEDIINKNIYDKEEIEKVFIKILDIINRISELPFDFCLADLHEKNVIINSYGDINLIDCDGFVINNKQTFIDGNIIMGKYLNMNYTSDRLVNINVSGDYFCLFNMIINYILHRQSVSILELERFNKYLNDEYLEQIIDRTRDIESFKLDINDIKELFSRMNYYQEKIIQYDDDCNKLLEKEIVRIRKLGGIYGE